MRIDFDKRRFGNKVRLMMVCDRINFDLLCIRSGVSSGTLSRILAGEAIKIDAILSVADVLNIDIGSYITNNGERIRDRINV